MSGGPDSHDPSDLDTDALLGNLGDALPSPSRILLGVIAVLALAHLVVAAPWAVGADPFGLLKQSTTSHQTRDGAVGVIVGVAGLLTVWRPRWALPCFALAGAALIGQLLAGLVDDTIAQTGIEELIHTGTVVLTTLIGLAAVRLAALGPSRPRGRPRLRSVPTGSTGSARPLGDELRDRRQSDRAKGPISG